MLNHNFVEETQDAPDNEMCEEGKDKTPFAVCELFNSSGNILDSVTSFIKSVDYYAQSYRHSEACIISESHKALRVPIDRAALDCTLILQMRQLTPASASSMQHGVKQFSTSSDSCLRDT